MRNLYPSKTTLQPVIMLMIVLLSFSATAFSQPFITTWKTDNAGVSNSTSITIPTAGGGYSYDVDWNNDGTFEQTGITGSVTHDFGTAGTYTIRIQGNFPRINFNSLSDKLKILQINQWGSISWHSMAGAFVGAANLVSTATDVPDLSGVTDMNSMFYGATSFNSDIHNWDVSNVTDMTAMFASATSFNSDIHNWDVSGVTDMAAMFYDATSFNNDISNWDVGNVTDMNYMFGGATSFNGDISNWDVSSVIDMSTMFQDATSFNQDISSWNVGNVQNMNAMFVNATSFNSDMTNWDISSVLDLGYMFNGATSFNGDISNWDVSSIPSMSGLFYGATSFNSNISNWDVSNITDMSGMFYGATSFNQDISSWNVSNVNNMSGMFGGASSFNRDISNWDVSNVTDMTTMFLDAASFNQDISSWNVSNVTNMDAMLTGTALSVSNYDKLLQSWSVLPLQTGVTLGADNLYYCSAAAARQSIIDNFGWSINDAGSNCSLLPVSWLSFTATLQRNGNALLQWRTATEINNAGFTVEKSTDSRDWKSIGFVPGHTTTQQPSSYSFTDDQVQNGTNYYRIKQTDVDGKISYSKIVSLLVSQNGAIRLYPNPGNGELTIEGMSNGKYQLHNAAGQLLMQGNFISSKLHLSGLKTGIYFIKIMDANGQLKSNSKLVIQ